MPKVIQHSLIFLTIFILTSAAMGDAFDQTVDRIKILEVELEQNQIDIDEKVTFIEGELRTFRTNHPLNAPKGEFESDADYAARLNRLAAAVAQRRAELEEENLSSVRADRLEMQTEISRLHRRSFFTNDVTATLGSYNANEEYFPITFVANNESVDARLYISRQNDAPNLKSNWDKVVKTAYISIDPGYRRALAQVKLEYPPLWEEAYTWTFHEVYPLDNNHSAVAFSADGKYIATGGTRVHTIWETSSGKELRQKGHNGRVHAVTFSPDGQYLATGDSLRLKLWQVKNGEQIWEKTKTYRIWTGATSHADFHAVDFSPDGNTLAAANDRSTFVADVNGGGNFWDRTRSYRIYTGSTRYARFYAVDFSPDGQYLATGDSFSDAVIWDPNNDRLIQRIEHRATVWAVAFSRDGQYLVTGDNAGYVSICEVSSGVKVQEIKHDGGWVGAVVFSPDGFYFAVGDQNGLITIYQMPQGEINIDSEITKVRTIKTSQGVSDLAWHPSGNFISDGRKVYRTFLPSEVVNLIPTVLLSSEIDPVKTGTQFTLDFTVKDVTDLAGWQTDVMFNSDVLSIVETKEDDFLKTGGRTTFFHEGNIDNTTGKVTGLSGAILGGSVSGEGTLFSITFEAKAAGDGQLQLLNTQLSTLSTENIPHELVIHPIIIEDRPLFEDVNKDKVVNIQDLVLVASNFGKTGPNDADVNEDGVVNVQDLVMVAAALGTTAAAPSLYVQSSEMLTAADIRQWLTQAQQLNLTDVTSQRGILFLEQLLATLTPKETALLPNYPNPFNPETWIPYQLAESADVKISIYAADGKLVRTLDLGRKPVGIYHHRNRAVYWDGKNEFGEPIASGVYFYTLTAGEFTATRKMLIRK
ncbi:MAG: T9SS type A sorting domain-containing protein [Candidatus Poribacteria bacterium]|nr:T9SS type A sorting domain-containing protein [Candidatus Poribacteria bacterium]